MRDPRAARIGAPCAVAGSVLLLIGTYLHPLDADPNDALAAFTEYAADHLWVASHLTQLAGVALMVAALLCLTLDLGAGGATVWTRLASGGAIASLALTGALQAVDGIALTATVDRWAAVPASQKDAAFAAAFAVRQIEIGFASVSSLVFGATAMLYGVSLLADGRYAQWLGGLAIAGGAAMSVSGVVIAYTGFSGLAMATNMPAGLLLVAWMLALGVRMWRNAGASGA